MSTLRPSFHFSPQSGWINDPNGLIRVDGTYHLFYQANPHGLVHGPMHWGHASSTDLATWQEHPIALYPEASGQCFSGSAVDAREGNVAPSLKANGDILLFYTAHRDGTDRPYVEDQAVAVADRTMTTFRKVDSNPVLRNTGPLDFRDPKVIWHEATKRWIMVVTHGQSIGIYSSPNALDWSFESEFGADEGRHGPGPWECPDLFPITVEGTGEEAWILVVGLGRGHISGGSGTQYFVGNFDGHIFRNRHSASTELYMDWGRDYYASQSFSGLASENPLSLAWMSNWLYANYTPAANFRGSMTLPRRLKLIWTPQGHRLVQNIDDSVAAAFDELTVMAGTSAMPESSVYRLAFRWGGPVGSKMALSLFGEDDPILTIERSMEDDYAVTCLRKPHPTISADREFETSFTAHVSDVGVFDVDVFVDHGLVEIGCAGGQHWFSNVYFPAESAGCVRLTG
jgi:fructan beta-fructosidase